MRISIEKKTLFCLLLMSIIISCKNRNNSNVPEYSIPQRNEIDSRLTMKETKNAIHIKIDDKNIAENWFNWDYVGKKIRFVPLETTNKALIKHISKVQIYNSKVYILDKAQSKILCFCDKGKFLWKIDLVGKAGFEYHSITDFYLNVSEGLITIYDSKSEKLISYSLVDGTFSKSTKYKSLFLNIYPFKDGYLHLTKNLTHDNDSLSYALIECDQHGSIRSKNYPFSSHWNNVVVNELVISSQSNKFLVPDLERNTIYEIDTLKGVCDKKYCFSFSNKNLNTKLKNFLSSTGSILNEKFIPKEHIRVIHKLNKENFLIGPINCFETDKQTILYFKYKDTYLIVAYWPEDGRYLCGIPYSNNDPLKYLLSKNSIMTSTSSEFVTAINPSDFFNELKKMNTSKGFEYMEKYLKRNPNIVKLLTMTDENSNPILVFITPR